MPTAKDGGCDVHSYRPRDTLIYIYMSLALVFLDGTSCGRGENVGLVCTMPSLWIWHVGSTPLSLMGGDLCSLQLSYFVYQTEYSLLALRDLLHIRSGHNSYFYHGEHLDCSILGP